MIKTIHHIKTKTIVLLTLAGLLSGSLSTQAQTIWQNFSGSLPDAPDTLASTFSSASLTGSSSSIVNDASGGDPGSYLAYLGLNGTEVNPMFTVTFGASQYTVFTNFTVNLQRPAFTGPTISLSLAYSINGGSFNNVGSSISTAGGGVGSLGTINLSSIAQLNPGDNIVFEFKTSNDQYPMNFDNMTFTSGLGIAPVPEPSTIALAGCGGLGILSLMRRRK